ncbi:hypothetical protein PARHAE_03281 [Paracoccus haematequi]|uniref:Uncharacterized protein n=1 Tax=Paracoccus haematequi TaxID=2491866 RepID=A0A3S4CL71_9RHOB|nr:hypothetical protein PARHAE_03281 [Paracoccus haematequi]
MRNKLTWAIVLVIIAALAYWMTRPDELAMPDGGEMTEAQVQETLEEIRSMRPEGEDGKWTPEQQQRLRAACPVYADHYPVENGPAGDAEIADICDSEVRQTSGQ